MMADEKIKNSNELEFAVFCIENVAAKLGVDAERVYQAFTEKSDIAVSSSVLQNNKDFHWMQHWIFSTIPKSIS